MNQYVAYILEILATVIAVVFVISFHEFAHAFVAVKCGDPTPKLSGRYTLNPVKHLDVFGLLMLIFAHFGWAKPVPVNPNNFKNKTRGMFGVAVAGVVTNYIVAFIAYPIFIGTLYLPDMLLFDDLIILVFQYVFILNLCFAVFNLLPIFPLDGFRIVEAFSKTNNSYLRFMYKYGSYLLLGLLLLGIIADWTGIRQLDVLGVFMNFCVDIIGRPITAFWGLFF